MQHVLTHEAQILVFDLNFSFWSLTIFSSVLCYCTAKLLSSHGRPTSFHPSSIKPVLSEHGKHINATFGGIVPFTISPDQFFVCLFVFFCVFQNFAFLIFTHMYEIGFVFVNIWPYGRKNFKRHGVILCTCLKMARSSKTAGHRAKRSEIWDLWILVTHIWLHFTFRG